MAICRIVKFEIVKFNFASKLTHTVYLTLVLLPFDSWHLLKPFLGWFLHIEWRIDKYPI